MVKMMRLFLFSARFFAENKKTMEQLKFISKEYKRLFGKSNLKTMILSLTVFMFSIKESLKLRFVGDHRKLSTSYIKKNLLI